MSDEPEDGFEAARQMFGDVLEPILRDCRNEHGPEFFSEYMRTLHICLASVVVGLWSRQALSDIHEFTLRAVDESEQMMASGGMQ